MKSMTGYGASEAKSREAEIAVSVKSVNGRFLETRFHLPKEYFPFESQLKKALGATFRRGTVDVFIHRRGRGRSKIRVNSDVAKSWLQAYRELSKAMKHPLSNEVVMERMTSLPQVFDVRDSQQASADEKKALQKAFQVALKQCQAERQREGNSLKVHLHKRLKSLMKIVKEIETHRREANHEIELRLKERLKKFGLEGTMEPARFAQEVVMLLDKSDISEELDRLEEHLQTCEKYLAKPDEQGKKLDFYSQELLREVNTIGSKANYAPITEKVVQAKGLIEAFKEQVQNIE